MLSYPLSDFILEFEAGKASTRQPFIVQTVFLS